MPGVAERLAAAGFVAAGEEAEELEQRAAGDAALLDALLARRLTGEPLAWIVGSSPFCGLRVRVDPGVYVPRWQTELLAERAAARLPPGGSAIDVCTGSGALALVLQTRRPRARVTATDLDERCVRCARANGVDAVQADLLDGLEGPADVVAGVVPYVPTPELGLLQRDTFTFEEPLAYDGGPDGCDLLRRVVADAAPLLRDGGALLLELGGDQATVLRAALSAAGFTDVVELVDEEGDVRGVEATKAPTG